MSTASCSNKPGENSKPRSAENASTHRDAATSASHKHADSWTIRRLLTEALPLLGKPLAHVKKHHGLALEQKALGFVLKLPAVGRRKRNSFVIIEVDEATRNVSELVVMLPIANDSDDVRAELVRRWGKPRTSREHKCRMRGCVYGTGPTIVVKEIETQLMWSIKMLAK